MWSALTARMIFTSVQPTTRPFESSKTIESFDPLVKVPALRKPAKARAVWLLVLKRSQYGNIHLRTEPHEPHINHIPKAPLGQRARRK